MESGGATLAAASATLTSSGAIVRKFCNPGAQAGGFCTLSQDTCAWNVSDFSLDPFADGELAVVTMQCSELGPYSLDLSDVSFGRTDGTPQIGCAESGTLMCLGCTDNADCNDANPCTVNETCTDDTCTRDNFCGVPFSRRSAPVATDALFTLRAAVALISCPLCECDVNAGGSITSSDALAILQASVGLSVQLRCFSPA
jgi:hypothetical protein